MQFKPFEPDIEILGHGVSFVVTGFNADNRTVQVMDDGRFFNFNESYFTALWDGNILSPVAATGTNINATSITGAGDALTAPPVNFAQASIPGVTMSVITNSTRPIPSRPASGPCRSIIHPNAEIPAMAAVMAPAP